MRALAAIWVLLHHAGVSVGHFIGPLPAGERLVANGYIGVDFFFVLSGFIIAFSGHRLVDTGRGLRDYAQARLIRIYVPYLPVGLGMFALYLLLPDVSAGDRSPGLLTTLTLLPSNSPPALAVAWTLVHEVLFYTLFASVFVSRYLLWALLIAWTSLIGYHVLVGASAPPLVRYFISPINLCFVLGVATYYLTRVGVPMAAALAGLVLGLAALIMEAGQSDPRRWLLALGFAGFIVAATSPRAQRRGPGNAALFLGAASYSIYLVHDPILSVSVRALERFAPGTAPAVAFPLLASVALVAGLAYYALYERHALASARLLIARHADPQPAEALATETERQ